MVIINLGGLLHDKVYRLMKKEDSGWYDAPAYYDKSGNYGFEHTNVQLGLNKKQCYWIFVAKTKEEAQQFLDGAVAIIDFMNETWFSYYLKKEKRSR